MTNSVLIAVIPCAILYGLAMYGAFRDHCRRRGHQPTPDYDKQQAELDAAFEPLSMRKGTRP